MSETRTFLLELHCEEIPARFLEQLCMDLQIKLGDWLVDQKIYDIAGVFSNTTIPDLDGHFYSPRKLAWRFSCLPDTQPDQTEIQVGPPQRMCVGEDGKPTIQGLKFAEKWGVDFSAVRFEQPAGKKEPCAVVTVTKKGRPTKELLAEALPGLIAGLHVPKAMRWGSSDFEFVRPIRSVLCLFGEEVVDFTVDGVRSGNTTWGHRLYHRQHLEPLVVKRPEDYEKVLEDAGIVVSFAKRKDAMAQQLIALASEVNGHMVAVHL